MACGSEHTQVGDARTYVASIAYLVAVGERSIQRRTGILECTGCVTQRSPSSALARERIGDRGQLAGRAGRLLSMCHDGLVGIPSTLMERVPTDPRQEESGRLHPFPIFAMAFDGGGGVSGNIMVYSIV